MCHSPSGAFRVHAPDRAAWALADTATAIDNPAASPPDTTFCAKRFITDLREKGDSELTFHFGAVLRQVGRPTGLLPESRPGPVLPSDVQTHTAGRPALDCREHPPAERTRGAETGTCEGDPLDGLVGAIGQRQIDRAGLRGESKGRVW